MVKFTNVAPLKGGYMITSIVGFIVSVIFIYPRTSRWGFTFTLFFALMFIIIMLITFMFYLLGYFTFVYEVGHEFHNNKWSRMIDRDLKMIMRRIEDYEEDRILEKIFEKGND